MSGVEEPFWKPVFAAGEFSWVMKMRRGDAGEFFSPQDEKMMVERRRWLEERPDLCLVASERGEALVARAWEMAEGLGHVEAPVDGWRDLMALAQRWEPDLLFLDLESWMVAAGCVCLPSSWDLRRWVGKSLDEVHGVVPRLQEQIGAQIGRFLERLEPGKSFLRENWGLSREGALNDHPELERAALEADVALEDVYFRVEQQCFTGLPGGVMMGIRIRLCPLEELAADGEVWETLTEKLRTMPQDVAEYKNLLTCQAGLVRAMEERVS